MNFNCKITRPGYKLHQIFWNISFIVRFGNIHPYDFNRILLKKPIDGVDYINASYISGEASQNSDIASQDTLDENVRDDPEDPSRWSNINFMACQGPLPNTNTHHLQLILENKIDIIVMLTRCDEKSKSTYLKWG